VPEKIKYRLLSLCDIRIQNIGVSNVASKNVLRLKAGENALYLNVKDFEDSIYIPFITAFNNHHRRLNL